MQVGTEVVSTQKSVKYLGIMLDSKLTYWNQLKHASKKASEITVTLSRLMANTHGPLCSKRKLLMAVIHSTVLYGSEIWADVLKKDTYRKYIGAVQRKGALRVASAYRTVSEPAVLVISGIIPIDLLAWERKEIYTKKDTVNVEDIRKQTRQNVIQKWQQRWNSERRGRWTARLITNINDWVQREHGEINYYLTQLFSGHGYFQMYLYHIGKRENGKCMYGDSECDDANHTFFECVRWADERNALKNKLGNMNADNIVSCMLRSEENWIDVAIFAEAILRRKKEDLDSNIP